MDSRTRSRSQIYLWAALGVLGVMLIVLGVFFYRALTPIGLPSDFETPGQGLEWVRSMYGFGPADDEQLLDPSSVAIAPNGEIYATDPVRARVMVFNPDGSFNRLLHTAAGGYEEGMFIRPESIDIDDRGNVYIADSWAEKIIVFDPDNEYVREWPLGEQARGVYVHEDEVYVLGEGTVHVFDLEGNKLGGFGERGPRPGQVDAYQGIASDGERIYIADALNQRIQAFDRNGELIWAEPVLRGLEIGEAPVESDPSIETSSAEGAADVNKDLPYDLPQDIVIDNEGRLIVVDAFMFQIIVVDPETGEVLDRYGDFGRTDGLFLYPTSVDYDPTHDWFAVADTRNNRVQLVRIPGTTDGGGAALKRALTSPYRYCAIPLLVALVVAIISVFIARRTSRIMAEEKKE